MASSGTSLWPSLESTRTLSRRPLCGMPRTSSFTLRTVFGLTTRLSTFWIAVEAGEVEFNYVQGGISGAISRAASMFNNFALDYPILAGVGLGAFIIFLFGFCFWFLIEGETGIAAATDDGDDGQTVDDKTKKLEKKYQ